MTEYRIEAEPSVDADIEAAFQWYESEEPALGFEFVYELRHAYRRILNGPFKYQNSAPALGEQSPGDSHTQFTSQSRARSS